MRKFSLSKRMQAIIDTVPECSVVADIGCDHGKILCSLLLSKKCRYGIGTDISEMCAIKTAELLEQCKISTGEVIVGDGLSTIEDRKVDCIILAGMGGREIDRILREAKKTYKYLVIQPMNDVDILRQTLLDLGYGIQKDYMICERGQFYDIILAYDDGDGVTKYSKYDIMCGLNSRDNADFVEYANIHIKKYKDSLKKTTSRESKKELKRKIKYLKKVSRRK